MGASVCFFFDESRAKEIKAGSVQEWDRLGENWAVDSLIMIDQTLSAGREWMEKFVPGLSYKQPWHRYRKIEEAIEEHKKPWVFIERKEKRPSRLCERTVGLYKYEHRPDCTYLIGGHYEQGIEGMPMQGDWVHIPTGGPCGWGIQIAAMVMYDRARKIAVRNEASQAKSKREREMRQGLEQATQATRSTLKILSKALEWE